LWKVKGKQLIETVQWALGIGNELAEKGFKMYEAGFLKAVSVGFWPKKSITNWDKDSAAGAPLWAEQLADLKLPKDTTVRTIYLEQEQIELSAVVIGANPNAVARGYKAGILTDADLDTISQEVAKRETASVADQPAYATLARGLAQQAFLEKLNRAIGAQ
jgi:hypothetical protein